MPTIVKERDLQGVRKRRFCYLCGQAFGRNEQTNGDHVPPKALFRVTDRSQRPLVLQTHPLCNESQSPSDEIISQLVSLIHTRTGARSQLRKHVRKYRPAPGERPRVVLQGIDLQPIVWRWIRAFHAALYDSYLPDNCQHATHLPFPEGREVGGKLEFLPIRPQEYNVADVLRTNIHAKTTDRIACFGGKCAYECCWVHADQGPSLCFFGLQLYDWESLAGKNTAPRRACTGIYMPPDGKPPSATPGTILEARFHNPAPLDPFR